jgi:hypothetical protein
MFESERLWPESIPDVVISLGTGIQPKTKGDRNSLHRLWAGFMDMLDGQSHSRDTEKGLERYIRGSFFRLNTILQRPIRLDNLKDLEELSRAVHISPKSRRDTENVALSLLLSNFYLSLDKRPRFESGLWHYSASILCRTDCKAVLSALNNLCPSSKKFITESCILGEFSPDDICESCCRYRKHVVLTVRHPDEYITISVKLDNGIQRKISGFPQRMSWFQEQEGLNNKFGTEDHDGPGALQCSICNFQSLPHKRVAYASSNRREKRVRF